MKVIQNSILPNKGNFSLKQKIILKDDFGNQSNQSKFSSTIKVIIAKILEI